MTKEQVSLECMLGVRTLAKTGSAGIVSLRMQMVMDDGLSGQMAVPSAEIGIKHQADAPSGVPRDFA